MLNKQIVEYFIFGRIQALRTLKDNNINYQEDDSNNKTLLSPIFQGTNSFTWRKCTSFIFLKSSQYKIDCPIFSVKNIIEPDQTSFE
jgi:hypothetical protein